MKTISEKAVSILLFVIFSINAFAVPANPKPIKYRQPDGSIITIILKGDEIIHWATTTDGYTILPNSAGAYEYAKYDNNEKLILSGVQANDPNNRSAQELSFLKNIAPGLKYSKQQNLEMKAKTGLKKLKSAIGNFPTSGTRKLLVILANFSNTTTTVTQAEIDSLMNQPSYNETGSFNDYYNEVSYGKLHMNSIVTTWVTVPHTHDYYGNKAFGVGGNEFIRDAVLAANPIVDFSQFDSNGDGYVDGVVVVHQGAGQEETGITTDFWSYESRLSYTSNSVTCDGKIVDLISLVPEINKSGTIVGIGVFAHEFGHMLGTLDFYDTGTNGLFDGTGLWDIMSYGTWNGPDFNGTSPAHHNAWSKAFFGWTSPELLSASQQVVLNNSQTSTDVVRYNTTTTGEYFLCENRQQTGFDTYLPGHGLIIYHVDSAFVANNFNSNTIDTTTHQGIYPMSAISTHSNGIETSKNSSWPAIDSKGCPWPGKKKVFNDATVPCSKSWVGANTKAPLTNIAEDTVLKTVYFCFKGCPTSIDNLENISDVFNIFPNPSTSKITIQFNNLEKENDLFVYNMNGQELIKLKLIDKLTNIDIGNFNSGIYFVKLINAKSVKTKKIIKN